VALAVPAPSPRIRVAALIPRGDGIVLVRHAKDGLTYHLLPGGGVEAGETLTEALTREVLEETGIECEPVAPMFINDSIAPDASRHVIQITFLVRPTGGGVTNAPVDPRVEAACCVPLSELRGLDLRPPMAAQILEAAAAGFAGPARYLGPMWSDSTAGNTGTGASPETDR
jgi:ADP-ribose pyrophosphatase YjhB (NUDIX family)